MNRTTLLFLVAVIAASIAIPAAAQDVGPRHRAAAGEKWRIAYYQGGDYHKYSKVLVSVVEALMSLRWMPQTNIPEFEGESNAAMWQWLSEPGRSEFIEFVADGFYTADWDESRRMTTRQSLVERLRMTDDIDLVIAMGTWAGKDLANDLHDTPTIVASTSDAIRAGIISSADDSGFDHVHARVDPERYARQVEFFHEAVGFEQLGIAFENSVEGRSYSSMDSVEKVARRRGFKVVACHTHSDVPDIAVANSSVIACFESLVRHADALYVTAQGGVNETTVPEIVRLARTHKIPTFSQVGGDEVRQGVLLSMSQTNFHDVGRFYARVIARVFHGDRPRDLEQVFEDQPHVALNVSTASAIGFIPSTEVLAGTDEFFDKIGQRNSD